MHRFITEILVSVTLSGAIAAGVFTVGARVMPMPAERVPLRTAATRGCREVPVIPLASSGIAGGARLCVSAEGVNALMEAENLIVGDTYTVWFTYLDRERPRGDESPDDTFGERPAGVAGRMDGGVANARRAQFSGDFPDLRPSVASEVTLRLYGRGPLSASDDRSHVRQLLPSRSSRLGTPTAGTIAAGEAGSIVAYAVFDLRPYR